MGTLMVYNCTIQMRDRTRRGEVRNLAVLSACPSTGYLHLTTAPYERIAHMDAGSRREVDELVRVLAFEVGEAMRRTDEVVFTRWLRNRSMPTEDSVFLTPPSYGLCDDPVDFHRREVEAILGTGA